jgi:hypothetical protein
MEPRLRSQRRWEILERFPRALLYRIGRAAQASVTDQTHKHDLIETLHALPEAALERALVEGLAWRDLQALCKRINLASQGSKAELAARILAAVDLSMVQLARWRPFAEARAFAQGLELTNGREWYAFARGYLPDKGTLPADIPKSPAAAYAKTGWTNWGDFLGTGNPRRRSNIYRPFPQARAYARSLGLSSLAEWRTFCHTRVGDRRALPPDIPAGPHEAYADRGWAGYGDWLGTGRISTRNYQYRSYSEACAFARALDIRTRAEWLAYCRGERRGHGPRPFDIPSSPDQVYRGRGWVSWGQFLGTNVVSTRKRRFRSYAAAHAYARAQRLRTRAEWRAWSIAGKQPAGIPAAPEEVYRGKGWVGWGDFLGTGNLHHSRIRQRSFATMRVFVRRLGLRTGAEFVRAKRDGRIPKDIPTRIDLHPEWKGWADFLGPSYTGRPRKAVAPARARRRRG